MHAASLHHDVMSCDVLLKALESAQVKPGQRVLIHGGSGGVGSVAVQIAKAWGAHVTSTCSSKNMQLVKVQPYSQAVHVMISYSAAYQLQKHAECEFTSMTGACQPAL